MCIVLLTTLSLVSAQAPAPEPRTVRVVMKDGTVVVGRLLNQDAFSIQLLAADQQLKSYLKSDLREYAILKSGETAASEGTSVAGAPSPGNVTFDRILHADREPQNWLTYSGGYASQRHSSLNQITRENVQDLTLKWVWRPKYLDKMETTPLVVDGVMYTVQNSEVVALDAATGRAFWTFRYAVPPESNAYLMVVKGLAIAGDRLFWATYDGHLIAIDRKTGKEIWNRTLLDWKQGYQLNVAPLVVKDKVLLGPATNEYGSNCWLAAYDVNTGNEVWRFKTVAEPGEPGNETWPGDSWQHGGAPIWVTGSYDPDTNLTFWGTGNPNPGWNGGPRNPGDNLYSDSVIALDADTGALKWHYQFTPNDEFDWDAVQVPVLADLEWQGKPRKVMLWANRNGFFYVLDRVTGQFLLAKAFVKQNWNVGFEKNGRPIKSPQAKPSPEGTYIEPGTQGGTNWYSPSFSPRTGLFYVSAWDNYSVVSVKAEVQPWKERRKYTGRAPGPAPGARPAPAPFRTESEGYGAVRAIDPKSGEKKWEFKMVDYTESGVLTTASDLLFSGGREGHFFALDARTGELLWQVNLGGNIANGPMTYAVDGRQYVAVCADAAMYVFGLQEQHPTATWSSIFNGKDFTGWVSTPRGASTPGNPADVGWKIEDGVIVGGQAPPGQRGASLVSQQTFKDLELEFDFMIAEQPSAPDGSCSTCTYNSGVYLRTGYQVNIGRREAGEFVGVVIHRVHPKAIRGNVLWLDTGDEKFPGLRKKNDWNHLQISFKGPHLQVTLNGTKISDVTDEPTDPAEANWKEAGPISFQWPPAGEAGGFAGFVKFRNIKVER